MLDWYPLSFQCDCTLLYPDQLNGYPDGIIPILQDQPDGPITDLWILSYGWNTSIEEGDTFYEHWVKMLNAEIEGAKQKNLLPQDYLPMFIGVYWPSKILADTTSQPTVPPAVATLPNRADFISTLRPIFAPEAQDDDPTFAQDFGAIYDFLAAHPVQKPQADELELFINTLKKYQPSDPHSDQPGPSNVLDANVAAISQGITNAFASFFSPAHNSPALNCLLDFLRVFSFWTMKARAGMVGAQGLAPLLSSFKETNSGMHMHLLGHSFGAKLVTSAVANAPGDVPVADSLILFQGAFSQFAFSRNIPGVPPSVVGPYVSVIENGLIANPLAVIYSVLDGANTNLYPLGMEPILQPDLILMDLNGSKRDIYQKSGELRGAIGANGVQGVDDIMLPVTLPNEIDKSALSKIRCINLNRTDLVQRVDNANLLSQMIGAHNDYSEPEIFHSIVEVSRLNRNR